MLMVLVQAFQRFQQMERKPPVTLAVIAFCVVGFFAPEAVGGLFGAATVQDACFSAKAIVTRFQLMRLVSSYWFHGDEISLAYNMSSLLWKGYVLETRMGSEAFASALAVLTLLVSVLSCATAAALNVAFSSREAFVACTHGISPILFALKVLMYNDPTDPHGNVSFYGMVELPKRWAALAEMALLQLMHPSLAMLAVHAGGALAGYAFLHPRPSHSSLQKVLNTKNGARR